ncbi:ABC transporter substrate-binding protein [Paenibacillus prosopidis]|uniref:Carbohydrate ABC transporter substrate-binding protein (CUT1 family) n=1 Tax=Paenibacillus prosopidis TaxID=630520 RepID=A0A368W7T8_9BACL|nr:sugar ABC transporter substrate-binding protein [Paenibacillus prosopidis]RCW52040.1 carbohydrate ABC transporter substrate-binding protein (CUT1 family) [Paenibacillus prosopidis]
MKRFRKLCMLTGIWTLLVSVLATGCTGISYSGDKNGELAQPFLGKTITLVTANHPWADAIRPLLPEFEAATGMNVIIQGFFEDQLTQKLTLQLTTGSATPDVFMYRPLQEGKLFYKNGWLEPLDDYAREDAEYAYADFSGEAIRSATVDGKLAGIPVIMEQEILYYRKDLLKKAGIPVPDTIEELISAVRKLHDPDNGVYGFIARGQRSPLVTQVSSFLYSEGGDFTNGQKATINTPEAMRAFSIYGGLLRDYGPPGVINMSWPQASAFFAEGKAAFYTDANSIYKSAIDPARSNISEHIGFASFPAGRSGTRFYNITSWGLAMNPRAVDKEAAWAFIRWATSKEIVLETQRKGNPGARYSVWNMPGGTEGFPKEMVEVIKQEGAGGVDHDRPTVVNVAEARETVGEIVQRVITGDPDLQQAADKANAALQAILDKEAE